MYCVVCAEHASDYDLPNMQLNGEDLDDLEDTNKGICADCMNIYLRVLKAMIERSTL